MAESNIRSDSVNVEQIMDQIRSRIREKRGVEYSDEQIRDLADARLEKLLDSRTTRADLLDRLRSVQPSYEPPELPTYEFGEETLYETHRGPLRFVRRLLNPILKLFFNPNPLIQALHVQSKQNAIYAEREAKREAMRLAREALYYELLHELVTEMTRTALEVKNLKMRLESMSGRLEFNERRARGLESVVYKPAEEESVPVGQGRRQQPAAVIAPPPAAASSVVPMSAGGASPVAVPVAPQPAGAGQQHDLSSPRSRRRRRRRGRRGGGQGAPTGGPGMTGPPAASQADATDESPAVESSDIDVLHSTEPPIAASRDGLETFTGAEAHRSESAHPSATDGAPASQDTAPDAPGSNPPDTQ